MTEFTREQAFVALHMRETFSYEGEARAEAHPGYVSFECPRCGLWHNCYDSPRLQQFLDMFYRPGTFLAKPSETCHE